MTPNRIQYELRERGITQKRIAEEIGVSETSVSDVILRQRISDKVMRAVADRIGKPVQLVFPEYYCKPPKRKTSKVAAM